MTASFIYRLLDADAWSRAQLSGAFTGSEHDLRDGFLHFSTAEQLPETAAKHYAGRADLVLLRVATDAVAGELRWEVSRGGALFPHLYAALQVSAVLRAEPFPLGADGRHVLPNDLD